MTVETCAMTGPSSALFEPPKRGLSAGLGCSGLCLGENPGCYLCAIRPFTRNLWRVETEFHNEVGTGYLKLLASG
jgi:hypothetical protein